MSDVMGVDAWEYGGARSLVILHERELRRFIEAWKVAKARAVPVTGIKYKPGTTLEDILVHVLHWARDYLVWSCENLRLPDPACAPVPAVRDVARELDTYSDHLLARWREPFREVPQDALCEVQYRTRWGKDYTVEALLEHAVVHPMRHGLQLEELTQA